jgi:hypothetical protein
MNQLFNLTAFYKNKSLRQLYLGLMAVLLTFQATTVLGQDGVSGNLSINNPTGNLTDYSNGSLNKLTLNLTATDAELGSRTVRFKLYIENGNSVFAIGSDVVAGATAAITLPFGSLQTFNSTQLAPYFRLENLQGINAGVYNSAMPEGLYRFTFEIITTNTNEVIGRISQQFWLTLNDPPLLNIPTNGENVNAANPTFSWIPRWSTTQTNYLFTLVNLGTNTNNVNLIQQFLAMENTPLHRSQPLTTNSYAYTTGVPALIAGNTYAWRVQAINGNFKNNGYSEIYVFKYLGTCESVTGLTTTARGTDAIDVRWNPSAIHGSYKVQYRKRSTGDANTWRWFELTTTNPFATLTQLEADTEYEIKVGGVCTTDMTTYTAPSVCRTAATTSDPTCGQNVSINITNTTPLAVLRINDTIRAAEIPVCVSKVTNGANGIFSGEGWGKLPWLGETKIKVRFSNVAINNEYKLTNGFIETVYDPNWGNMLSIDGLFEGGQTVGIVRTGKDTTDFAVNFAINGPSNIVFAPNGNGGGTITVTGSNGQTQTFNVTSLPTTIKDSQGRVYVVKPPNGAVSLLGQQQPLAMSKAELNGLSPDKGVVTFLPHGFYAFDAHDVAYEQDVLWRVKYERLGDYGVPRKAAAPGKPDVLKARITLADNALNADNVKFMNSKGMSFTSRRLAEAGTYEIDIVGGPGGDAQEIYALYPKANETGKYWSLGKILIAAYTPQKRKLVLVPVNGANVNLTLIADSLNTIYKPIGIEWEVTKDNNFQDISWDVNGDAKLQIDETGFWSTETTEMRLLKKNYAAARVIDANSIYIFVLNEANKPGVLGDMPRAKQFGFMFLTGNNQVAQTVAHEVGHGVFHLKHTFDSRYNLPQTVLRSNLMNYGGGNTLAKFQWDAIHDPGIVIGLFDKDEDVQNYVINQYISTKFLNYAAATDAIKYYSFLSPSGKIISIPNSDNSQLFQVEFTYGSINSPNGFMPQIRVGTLDKFTVKEGSEYKRCYFDFNNNSYKCQVGTTEIDFIDNAPDNANIISGFIFPLPYGDKYMIYKFPRTGINKYSPNQPLITFSQVASLGFFDTRNPITDANGVILEQNFDVGLTNSERWTRNELTANMTAQYGKTASLIYIDKIAQIRNVYPEYFASFTQANINWLKPVTARLPPIDVDNRCGVSETYEATCWKWGYLMEHSYNGESNTKVLSQEFLTQFIGYIEYKELQNADFWTSLNSLSDPFKVRDFIYATPILKIEEADIAKREIAFEILMNRGYYCDDEMIKIVASVASQDDRTKRHFLQYIEQAITIKKIEEKYRGFFLDENYTKFMSLFRLLIPNNKSNEAAYRKMLGEPNSMGEPTVPKELITLDADLIKNGASRYKAFIKENNKIYFSTEGETPLCEDIAYDELMPVQFLTPFEFGEKKYQRYQTENLPAIYVAALLQKQSADLFAKKAWLVVDGASFLIGIGELNLAIKGVQGFRAMFAVSDVIASAVSAAVQISSDNTIPPETKKEISIYCAFLQAPSAIQGLGDLVAAQTKILGNVEQVVQNPITAQRNVNSTGVELLRNFLTKARGSITSRLQWLLAGKMPKMSILLDAAEASIVLKGLSKLPYDATNRLHYLVVHAKEGKFHLLGNGIDQLVGAEELALWIKNAKKADNVTPVFNTNDKIVLLSCNDAPSSQSLADALGELPNTPRSVIAWEGEVEVFENGYIRGNGACKEFSPSTNGQPNARTLSSTEIPKGKNELPTLTAQSVLLGSPSFEKRLITRLNNDSKFSLTHNSEEIIQIVRKGKKLNLSDDIIDDMLYISCRNAKPISASELILQMDNWVNVISRRGFPYRFSSIGEFNQFKQELKSSLNNIGVTTSDVRIQGSSLRTPRANDVDLAAIISESEFNNFLINRFSSRITKNGISIDLRNKTTQQLLDIVVLPKQY